MYATSRSINFKFLYVTLESLRLLDNMFIQISKRINLAFNNSIKRTSIIGEIIARASRKESVPKTSIVTFAMMGSDLISDGVRDGVGESLEQT